MAARGLGIAMQYFQNACFVYTVIKSLKSMNFENKFSISKRKVAI